MVVLELILLAVHEEHQVKVIVAVILYNLDLALHVVVVVVLVQQVLMEAHRLVVMVVLDQLQRLVACQ